jgi:hypothetical protein
MALFRRKGGESGEGEQSVEDASAVQAAGTPMVAATLGVDDGETITPVVLPDGGPFDSESAPADELPRLDLGALRVPIVEGIEMNLDVASDTGAVTGVNYTIPNVGLMQISVFAAPRTAGIWDEVREEIIASAGSAGGSLATAQGGFGYELRGQVPTDQPGQFAPARFVGVNGPRWFARAVLSGEPAINDEMGEALLALFRMCVVHRGSEAMPVRELLPMAVPKEVQEAAEAFAASPEGQAAAKSTDFNPFERGPELRELN